MRIERWLVGFYGIACVLALAAIPMSAAGWIARDPLSAVPAFLLGLPWSYLLLRLIESESAAINMILVALAMSINAAVLWALRSALRAWLAGRRRNGGRS